MTNDLNHFQHMEDPEERKPEELRTRHDKRKGFIKKNTAKSVSVKTYNKSAGVISLIIWVLFIAIVALGTSKLVGIFING